MPVFVFDPIANIAKALAAGSAISIDDSGATAIIAALLIYRRQGGHASNWQEDGVTNYTPPNARIQVGTCVTPGTMNNLDTTTVGVTFPVPFSAKPIVLVSSADDGKIIVSADYTGISTSAFSLKFYSLSSSVTVKRAYWFAFGAE